jgi:ankyrin repeat protein
VDINYRNNKDSETALLAAAGSGDLHTVKLILEDPRTDLNAIDKSGKTTI